MTITVGGEKPISTICYRHVTFYILAYVYTYIGSAKLHFHVFFVNAQKTLYMYNGMIYDLKYKLIFNFMGSFLFYALQRFDIFQVISYCFFIACCDIFLHVVLLLFVEIKALLGLCITCL